jgi:hypothetical protein
MRRTTWQFPSRAPVTPPGRRHSKHFLPFCQPIFGSHSVSTGIIGHAPFDFSLPTAGDLGMLSAMYGRAGPRRFPDLGEAVGVVLLGVIAVWGAWFGVQSMLTLWWPVNVAYLLAGLAVAAISTAVARALLLR